MSAYSCLALAITIVVFKHIEESFVCLKYSTKHMHCNVRRLRQPKGDWKLVLMHNLFYARLTTHESRKTLSHSSSRGLKSISQQYISKCSSMVSKSAVSDSLFRKLSALLSHCVDDLFF